MLTKIHTTSGVVVDLDARPEWIATGAGRFGSCRVRIGRESPAWDDEVVARGARILVEVMGRFGPWRGITDGRPDFDPAGVTLTIEHQHAWTAIRHVSGPRLFQSAPAGIVARVAVRQALIGHDGIPVRLGQFTICPPLVDIELSDQSLADVLAELADLSGQEWYLDERLRFHWVMRQGVYREFMVTDDGRLFPSIALAGEDAAEFIEVDDAGRRFVSHSPEAARLWPAQVAERI